MIEPNKDISSINYSAELRDELEHAYGSRVKHGGNMSKKQFFDMIMRDVIDAEYFVPFDLNDMRAIFDYAQEVDAVSMSTNPAVASMRIADAIGILKKHHQQSKIRHLAAIISISAQNKPSAEHIQPMADFLHSIDYDFMYCLSKRKDINAGDIAVTIIASFYQDVSNESVRIALSKKLAHLLRHSGMIDAQGFCNVDTAMKSIGVTYDELKYIVEHDSRYELAGDSEPEARIRARYGHSGKVKIDPGLALAIPPLRLYHATTAAAIENILGKEEGLLPMSRQHVHLSESPEAAIEYAKRRKGATPVLLEVNAYSAFTQGTHFYKTSDRVWLAENIPHYFVQISENA